MSQPSNQLSPPPPTSNQQPRPPRRYPRPLSLILIFGVIIPLVATFIPPEIGRWQLASAIVARSKGNSELAYEKLERAAYWFPNSPELLLQRTKWKLQDNKRAEALEDAERAV